MATMQVKSIDDQLYNALQMKKKGLNELSSPLYQGAKNDIKRLYR